jgi:hypothetical protein
MGTGSPLSNPYFAPIARGKVTFYTYTKFL